MLSRRYESEKTKLEANAASPISGYTVAASVCCNVIPEIMCRISGFETWMDSIPIADDTSLLLDLLLLEDLSEAVVADARDLRLVRLSYFFTCWNDCVFYAKPGFFV